ncbi:hypothetical protein CapIbe_003298 [Capra ibex]
MKAGVTTFLAAGALLGGTDLYFPVEQYIYRGNSGGACIRIRESLGEASEPSPASRAALLPPLLCSAASLLEPPLPRPRQLPGAKTPAGSDPRADRQPLPEACV